MLRKCRFQLFMHQPDVFEAEPHCLIHRVQLTLNILDSKLAVLIDFLDSMLGFVDLNKTSAVGGREGLLSILSQSFLGV